MKMQCEGCQRKMAKCEHFFGERGFENDVVLWIWRGIQIKEAW